MYHKWFTSDVVNSKMKKGRGESELPREFM